MAQPAQHFDTDPQRLPSLSPDEQRIANAVVAALQSELKPMKDTLEQHTKILEQHSQILEQHSQILEQHTQLLKQHSNTLEQHTKILANVQLELRDINKILAGAGLIIDDPDA